MKCDLTTTYSSGIPAISILYPKWDGKGEQYLPAYLKWADGMGYMTKDWSHYGKMSFDAWVDGDKPFEVTVELHDKTGRDWTKELMVEPGKKNTFELTLQDAGSVIDVSDIQMIVFDGIRPTRDTRLTVNNFRLLPGDKLPLATFDLVYPNYRETILPNAASIKVSAELQPAEYGINPTNLMFTLTAASGKVTFSNRHQVAGNLDTVSVPATKLPVGPVKLTAVLADKRTGKVLATKDWILRKLSKAELSSTKVYIDEHDNTVVDSKPFFPIGWFDNPSLDHLAEIADSPFNTILAYGANTKTKLFMNHYLDILQTHGMKLIYCMNDIYPTATYLDQTGWEGVHGNDNIADAVVKAYKDNPAILAWYLNDERPKELEPRLERYYQRVRNDDPNHPCYVVIYQMPEVKYFPSTTDIMGVDRYPIPTEPVSVVTHELQVSTAAVKGHKPTWAVIQAFGWYQYNDAFPDRGRIPTKDDLTAGRAPTYDESRCMTYLALVQGAKGLIYYCYYDMRVLPQYAQMWSGMKQIASEVKALSPVLLSPNDLGEVLCMPADAGIRTKLKELNGHFYLIAVNSQETPHTVTFDLKHALTNTISVMFEERTAINVKGTKLTDSFKPLEVHVYDLGPIKW
jgi:hypothetical protein